MKTPFIAIVKKKDYKQNLLSAIYALDSHIRKIRKTNSYKASVAVK